MILWHEQRSFGINPLLIWHLPCAEAKLGAGREGGRKTQVAAPSSGCVLIWGDKTGPQQPVKGCMNQRLRVQGSTNFLNVTLNKVQATGKPEIGP